MLDVFIFDVIIYKVLCIKFSSDNVCMFLVSEFIFLYLKIVD